MFEHTKGNPSKTITDRLLISHITSPSGKNQQNFWMTTDRRGWLLELYSCSFFYYRKDGSITDPAVNRRMCTDRYPCSCEDPTCRWDSIACFCSVGIAHTLSVERGMHTKQMICHPFRVLCSWCIKARGVRWEGKREKWQERGGRVFEACNYYFLLILKSNKIRRSIRVKKITWN